MNSVHALYIWQYKAEISATLKEVNQVLFRAYPVWRHLLGDILETAPLKGHSQSCGDSDFCCFPVVGPVRFPQTSTRRQGFKMTTYTNIDANLPAVKTDKSAPPS